MQASVMNKERRRTLRAEHDRAAASSLRAAHIRRNFLYETKNPASPSVMDNAGFFLRSYRFLPASTRVAGQICQSLLLCLSSCLRVFLLILSLGIKRVI